MVYVRQRVGEPLPVSGDVNPALKTRGPSSSQDAVGQYQELIHNLAFAQEMHCSLDGLTQNVRNRPPPGITLAKWA